MPVARSQAGSVSHEARGHPARVYTRARTQASSCGAPVPCSGDHTTGTTGPRRGNGQHVPLPPRGRDLPVVFWMSRMASCLGWGTEARGQAVHRCIRGSRPGSPPASRSFGTVQGGFAPCAPCDAACCAVAGGHPWTTQKSPRSVTASHGHRLRLRAYKLQEFSPIAFSCRILQ